MISKPRPRSGRGLEVFNMRLITSALILFLSLFITGFSSSVQAAAAYAIVPSAGAVFDATEGIIPQAAPYTFAATAANDAVIAARAIPVSVTTPYGVASGSVTTAGVFSKGVAASLGKSLMRLNLPVQVGMALYDAYMAANMVVQPDGSFSTVTAGSALFWDVLTVTQKMSLRDAADSRGLANGWANQSCTADHCVYTWGGVNKTSYCCQNIFPVSAGTSPAVTAPATLSNKDIAIDSFSNAAASNAVRLAWEAYSAKVPLPSISVVGLQSPPVSLLSPWQDQGFTIDANGNKVSTSKQAQIDFIPSTDPLATTETPLAVKITENTQMTNSVGAPVGSSSAVIAKVTSGVTPSASVVAPVAAGSAAPFPTDYNRESTQQKILDILGLGAIPYANTATDAQRITDAHAVDDAAIHKLVDDSVAQENVDELATKGIFSLPFAATACVPYSPTFKGKTVNLDTCKYTDMLRTLIGWLFALFGAWEIYGTIFRRTA